MKKFQLKSNKKGLKLVYSGFCVGKELNLNKDVMFFTRDRIVFEDDFGDIVVLPLTKKLYNKISKIYNTSFISSSFSHNLGDILINPDYKMEAIYIDMNNNYLKEDLIIIAPLSVYNSTFKSFEKFTRDEKLKILKSEFILKEKMLPFLTIPVFEKSINLDFLSDYELSPESVNRVLKDFRKKVYRYVKGKTINTEIEPETSCCCNEDEECCGGCCHEKN